LQGNALETADALGFRAEKGKQVEANEKKVNRLAQNAAKDDVRGGAIKGQ